MKKQFFEIDGKIYHSPSFGFGKQLSSYENKVRLGELRIINGYLMIAYEVKKKLFSKNEVHWCLTGIMHEQISVEMIREFIEELQK